jgi:tyrosine aminotransferase
MPSPGFPLYSTLANVEFEARTYRLSAERNWEVDLQHLESLINERTRLIIVINPSNPCGSVYSREHLHEIAQVAKRHRLPLLSDEVYEKITFDKPFLSLAEFCDDAPVVVVGCLSKRWLVPGWRLGWSLVFDKLNVMTEFKTAFARLKNALITL